VDKDGKLWHNGAPMIHPGILEMIFESVCLEEGDYILRMGQQACQLEVADTFYVVQRAERDGDRVRLSLNDGSEEILEPSSLWIGEDDVIYCLVKDGGHSARFLRSAYYQLTQWVEQEDDGFALVLGETRYPLREKA
jgi:hypothetical protein